MGNIVIPAFGGTYANFDAVTATENDVVEGKTIIDATGNPVHGNIPNKGDWSGEVSVGSELLLPRGFYDGTGKVSVAPLNGTAKPAEVLSGKTFYSGNDISEGTMIDRGAISKDLGIGETYTIPAGYHNGNGRVASSVSSVSANASQVLSGATFYGANGRQTGSMPNYGGQRVKSTHYFRLDNQWEIGLQPPAGYYDENSRIWVQIAELIRYYMANAGVYGNGNNLRLQPTGDSALLANSKMWQIDSNGRWKQFIAVFWQYN